jgi:hypothetical protein
MHVIDIQRSMRCEFQITVMISVPDHAKERSTINTFLHTPAVAYVVELDQYHRDNSCG